MQQRKIHPLIYLLIVAVDLGLLVASFYLAMQIKYLVTETLFDLSQYREFFLEFSLLWIGISWITKKYNIARIEHLSTRLYHIVKANLLILGVASVLILGFKLHFFSRLQVFGIIVFSSLFEISISFLIHRWLVRPQLSRITDIPEEDRPFESSITGINISILDMMLFDIILISISFLIIAWIKPATVAVVLPNYWKPLVFFIITWVLISVINRKYRLSEENRISRIIARIIIVDTIIAFTVMVIGFAIKFTSFSRLMIFGTVFLSTTLEVLSAWILFNMREFRGTEPAEADTSLISHSKLLEESPELAYEIKHHKWSKPIERYDPGFAIPETIDRSVLIKLLNRYLAHQDELFEFLNEHIALENIHKERSTVLNSANYYNVDTLDDDSHEMFINLNKMNDFRRINKYLIRVNEILQLGGIFVGGGVTIVQRRRRLFRRMTRVLGYPLHILDFLFNRVFPKITFLQGLYFTITKGKNRPLSQCEMLGRLYFCGFRVLRVREINQRLWFIAIKEQKPSEDENPSYGPLFKMRRSGKGGKTIYVYKFRTMHPYAEYLQHYMVENYGYGEKGKIENDFRVTSWGRFMRRLWLDELPQMINLLKGDLALVGVRPLSQRFLAEYPPDLITERSKYRPGCVPPYVALRMQKVEQYLESERIYLEQKNKHPFWTDVKFFFWAVFNIVTNRIRSE